MIDVKRRTPTYLTKPHIFFNSKWQYWDIRYPYVKGRIQTIRRQLMLAENANQFVAKLNGVTTHD